MVQESYTHIDRKVVHGLQGLVLGGRKHVMTLRCPFGAMGKFWN